MKKIVLLACFIFFAVCGYAQLQTVRFSQIDSLQKKERRIMAVFIHTDWCAYCESMKQTTFKNEAVIEALNKRFYFVPLNAEEKKAITFHNHTFRFKPTGNNTGIHELAEQLAAMEGKVSYPALCFLNSENEILHQQSGFINANDLMTLLKKLCDLKQ